MFTELIKINYQYHVNRTLWWRGLRPNSRICVSPPQESSVTGQEVKKKKSQRLGLAILEQRLCYLHDNFHLYSVSLDRKYHYFSVKIVPFLFTSSRQCKANRNPGVRYYQKKKGGRKKWRSGWGVHVFDHVRGTVVSWTLVSWEMRVTGGLTYKAMQRTGEDARKEDKTQHPNQNGIWV